MILRRLLTCFVLCLCFLSFTARGQGFLRADGTRIVNEAGENYLLKGMGLGGWMLQEGYMMKTAGFAPTQHQLRARITEVVGEAAAEEFYQNWRDNHFAEADLQKMLEVGFNSVRLPMHYNLYTLPIEEEPIAGEQTWLDEGFARTDSLISWCKARGMYVILDLHAAPGGQGDDIAISDRDLSKPSLWDSEANKDKTVALWRRLAERYADEPTVAGYDLINEINYDLPGNVAIRNLYGRITDTIRQVDRRHILFIEGNGFANDFTGLTPPWDDNMAYSPHKYWNYNNQGSVQWMLDLGAEHNVPIYLGETGENSNVWFHDAAKLLEDNNIGFAWWPWKKIDDIAGPVSIELNDGYQALLDYWSGNGPKPSAAEGINALAQLTEDALLENADFQQDVTHALLTQTQEEGATVPYLIAQSIPGAVLSTDYDMGGLDNAYFDTQVANYRISTGGDYTPWNNGFQYRNDGVDIERSQDTELTNGYNVGWTDDGEWLQYTVDVAEDGLYDVTVRTASGGGGGRLSLAIGEDPLTGSVPTGGTGGWQTWQNTTIENVALTTADTKLRLYVDQGGFNLGGMRFTKVGELNESGTGYLSGVAVANRAVNITMNKSLKPNGLRAEDFTLTVNGRTVSVSEVSFLPGSARTLRLTASSVLKSTDDICVSYTGSALVGVDDRALAQFNCRPVDNLIAVAYAIPGTLQAEDFFRMAGVETEASGDDGGTLNIGFLDPGDFLDYNVDVAEAGAYAVDYRTAADGFVGRFKLQLLDDEDNATELHDISFPATGGWQTYRTTAAPDVTLPAGVQRLRILVVDGAVNVNYMVFSKSTSLGDPSTRFDLTLSPNPASDFVILSGDLPNTTDLTVSLTASDGRRLRSFTIGQRNALRERIALNGLARGVYLLRADAGDGGWWLGRVVVE